MKQKLLILLLVLTAAFCCVFGFTACDDETSIIGSEGLEYFDDTLPEYGHFYCVSGIGTCTDTDIIIPNSYKGSPVLCINDYAFEDCTNITSITIPNTVIAIGHGAFDGCRGLTCITMPESVTGLDDYVFRNCISLTDINFGGTIAQWRELDSEFAYLGNGTAGNYIVHCKDGDIAKINNR